MNDLQRRRIESALSDAHAIESQMDDIDESMESIRLKVDELVCSLHSIRLGMIREADEATAKEGTES